MNEVRSTQSIATQAVQAYQAGKSINANPFPPDSEAHTLWRRVFVQCQRDLGGLSTARMVDGDDATRFEVAQA